MSLATSRWLIGRGPFGTAEDLFLHVFDDGDSAWSPDRNRALRFATEDDADRFGSLQAEPFHSVEVPTALLAVPHDFDEDEDDFVAA